MSVTYRKWGRVARFENGTLVRVDEAGEAVDGAEFVVRPLSGERPLLPEVDTAPLVAAARALAPMTIERLVMTEGVSLHECGGVSWSEHTRRMHLSIAIPPARVLVDEAGFELDDDVVQAIRAFRGRAERRPAMVVAPRVAAAILPLLIGEIEMEQRGDGASRDGRGMPVETCRITADRPRNAYRPSYRVRPLLTWFNVAALPFGKLDSTLPRAVALLAPPEGRSMNVLCDDGYARTFGIGRVAAAGEAERWYPYGAGTWGGVMLLESHAQRQ